MTNTCLLSGECRQWRDGYLRCFRRLSDAAAKMSLDAWSISSDVSPINPTRVAVANALPRFLTESENLLTDSATDPAQSEKRVAVEFRYKSAVQYLALLDYLRPGSGRCSRLYRKRLAEVEHRQAALLKLNDLVARNGTFHTESLLFNCGMSAYGALCDHFSFGRTRTEERRTRPVVFCTSAYNENEWVVLDAFGKERILLVRPDDTGAILDGIYRDRALAVFCEILTNNIEVLRFPLREILDRLQADPPPQVVYLVVDVTASGNLVALDRLLTSPLTRNVILILTESLQKFYQHGLEVTSGGMVHLVGTHEAAVVRLARGLRSFRNLNHTALEPFSLYKYRLLEATLEELALKAHTHWENTHRLGEFLRGLNHPFLARVAVPTRTEGALLPECAPYLWLILKTNDFHSARLLVFCMIQIARRLDVNIQYRDSFYFNSTTLHMSRDYYQGVRVSSGTEDIAEAERLKIVCRDALDAALRICRDVGARELELRTDQQLAAIIDDDCRNHDHPL